MPELPDLLTIPGITIIVLLLVQYVVKPLLRRRLGLPPYGEETQVKKADFSLWVNIVSVLAGVLFGFVAQLLLNADLALTGGVIFLACLRGFMGGIGAIGGYELGKNYAKARQVG